VSAPIARRERLAAIDVGSNSIRLLVAEWDPETGLEVIDEIKEQPRLATGLHANGELDADAMEAAFNALRRMLGVAERRGVTRTVAVATSAIRDASNGPAFAERVRRELGLELDIISEEQEARLSWVSVAHHFRLDNTRAMIADIGGGSLELVAAVDGLVEATASLPLGAVRLTEAFPPHDDNPWVAVRAMRKAARRHLKKAMPWRDWRQATVIGSGGSFTNLARIAAARRGLATDPIHGTTVTTGEVESLVEWLATMTTAERAKVPGLNPQRADIILAGIAVTAELMSLLDARELTVSAFGLREGLLLDMVGAESAPSKASDPLRLLREFVDRCRGDRRHVEQVRLLALTLYDALADELGCNAEERWLLEAAALLHDTGQLVSYARHHKHSYQLIMHADRLGIGLRERTLVALISRYHRKKGPSRKHEEFAALQDDDQQIVRRLSGLLRVADGLDRGHTASVDRMTVTLLGDRCIIRAYPRLQGADLSLEVWGADRKKDVLEKGLGRDVVVAAGI
jgi:exopolyphosphatase/guanosine-5'-triphosphate,3'-diphosphate pyrophosphatase